MARRNPPLHLGLTGGIGSGKSTVAGLLATHGAAIIDADAISRATTAAGGAALPAIAAAFGPRLIGTDGALDRAAMRAQVYGNPGARQRLEAIIHPLVGQEIERQTRAAHQAGHAWLVFDIPLLAESGHWAGRLDAVVVVDCSAETQITRVMQRSGLSREVVQGIMASQATRPARRAVADAVIANDGDCTLANLQQQARQTAALFGL